MPFLPGSLAPALRRSYHRGVISHLRGRSVVKVQASCLHRTLLVVEYQQLLIMFPVVVF